MPIKLRYGLDSGEINRSANVVHEVPELVGSEWGVDVAAVDDSI